MFDIPALGGPAAWAFKPAARAAAATVVVPCVLCVQPPALDLPLDLPTFLKSKSCLTDVTISIRMAAQATPRGRFVPALRYSH